MEEQAEYRSEKDGVKAVCVDEGVKCDADKEARRKHVKEAIEKLTRYMKTYDRQIGYLDYSDETIIDDILYGLGAALSEDYMYADGYRKFKERLKGHLNT